MNKSNYWKRFWNENKIVSSPNPQIQVGRTVHGIPIDSQPWIDTVNFIMKQLSLPQNKGSALDLCCGNGSLTKPLSERTDQVTAIDFSTALLTELKNMRLNNVDIICEDVLTVSLPPDTFDSILFYFAIQHFTVKQALMIIQKLYLSAKSGSITYIGDIPDVDRRWDFFYTPEYRERYFSSLLEDKPIIGTWFEKRMLCYYCEQIGFSSVQVIEQPDFMINHHYRFDLLLKK